MMTDDEKRYEDLRHFITNSGSPARGARYLLTFEETMNETAPPKHESESSFRAYAAAQYQAVVNPSLLATVEQVEYCRRTKEEMEKWRAMYDAGWKTPAEEGYETFDPKVRPVDWDGTANPYPSGTADHDEWDDGYHNAIMRADAELEDAYKAMEAEDQAEEERMIKESSLESFSAHVESLAGSRANTFLAITAIHDEMFMLSSLLAVLDHELGKQLPNDLHERLLALIDQLGQECENREIERISSVEVRLRDFKQLVSVLQTLGAEIAERRITTRYGIIPSDLYHFWHVVQDKIYRESKQGTKKAKRTLGKKKPKRGT